jgi:addiction module HigA family antidote
VADNQNALKRVAMPLQQASACFLYQPVNSIHRLTRNRVQEMSIPNTTALKRKPTHPGEMLREDFMPDYSLTVSSLAHALDVSRQSVNELLRERRALTPEMALRLARLFGNSPEFWLNAQRAVSLWEATQRIGHDVMRIQPLATP